MKKLDINKLNEIIELLNNDGIIAFPTDTVYGLGCLYNSPLAIDKIKKTKGRDGQKPLPMMVSNIKQIEEIAYVSEDAQRVINQFMPGPLTVVLKKQSHIEDYITNGFETIAIRIPNHSGLLSILHALGQPMLVTSANLSNKPDKYHSQDVIDEIGALIDGIIEGSSDSQQASTIVDLTSGIKILREGPIKEIDLMKGKEYENCDR